ncbi:hypothetical protein [Nonomuraea sp. NPDC049784]|uniref:hypothetical protein n=1 Tax=Nonomuraea sp. NPDC049784 TaxID=3154361 RepID=UPI0033D9C8DD
MTTSISTGPGRALIAVYGLFSLAAGSRAAVQIVGKFDQAPLAYSLSAFAAAVYIALTVALWRGARLFALVGLVIELVGVLVIGTLSLLDPAAFPDETVWSAYGKGYAFIPLVLPIVGLYWVLRRRR